ncbi:spindle pole body component 110-like isoform X3 [Xenia sp. Carnegie-2017]|uniref:spindle pole body component 110-like isoform X3 n=1 Tax=Xenia sp. Carnegie-2017 TaxID=2897299 RepID=UPI001F04FBF0|nr:spindle pole body component 110-like isoform X3 [Xenia sp. Carnegie-2017]
MATMLNDDQKRWCVYGIVLNNVLIPAVRPYLENNILNEYNGLKKIHKIDVQTTHIFPSTKYSLRDLHYKNINNNKTKDKNKFNYEVKSHVDFGKLFLQNHMAKFNSYNSCDASAVLNLLERIPIFSSLVQNAAKIVRENRNSWGHCNFEEWNETDFLKKIDNMKKLVKELCLATEDEVLNVINYWKNQALTLWTNDRALREELEEHINNLSNEIEEMKFENEDCKKLLRETLNRFSHFMKETLQIKRTVHETNEKVDEIKDKQKETKEKVDELEDKQKVTNEKELCLATEDEVLNDINHWKDQALTLQTIDRTLCEVLKDHINRLREEVEEMKFENQEYKKLAQDTLDKCIDQLKRRIEKLEDELEKVKDTVEKVKDDVEKVKDDVEKVNDKVDQLHQSKINDFAICDSDIDFHYQKFDPETRKWLIEDFSAWFEKPGESRAFVFMGDAGVGKTVMSAAIAQRAKDDGKLGATFFCRHYDGTRRDPRSLLASVAYQLEKHNEKTTFFTLFNNL